MCSPVTHWTTLINLTSSSSSLLLMSLLSTSFYLLYLNYRHLLFAHFHPYWLPTKYHWSTKYLIQMHSHTFTHSLTHLFTFLITLQIRFLQRTSRYKESHVNESTLPVRCYLCSEEACGSQCPYVEAQAKRCHRALGTLSEA